MSICVHVCPSQSLQTFFFLPLWIHDSSWCEHSLWVFTCLYTTVHEDWRSLTSLNIDCYCWFNQCVCAHVQWHRLQPDLGADHYLLGGWIILEIKKRLTIIWLKKHGKVFTPTQKNKHNKENIEGNHFLVKTKKRWSKPPKGSALK